MPLINILGLHMTITLKTHKMLWGRSGNRCAFPECRKILVEDETETDNESIIGDEAHIVAKEENGPRGKSTLTQEQRDKFDNLILLCKNHHKVVDDQPVKYSVEMLTQMKRAHIEWFNGNSEQDKDKLKDDEIYAMYIDDWIGLAAVNSWEAWSSWVLGAGQPSMSIETYENLKKLNDYILSRVWPKRYANLEAAFVNFRLVLNDFLRVFSEYMQKEGPDENLSYTTEKFYKQLHEWDPQKYEIIYDKYDYHVDLVQDLMCELTRAGNYLSDQIRKSISSSYRIKEGLLLVTSGPHMDMSFRTYRLEYKPDDLLRYPGLKKFMEIRKDRDFHFGEGVSEDY